MNNIPLFDLKRQNLLLKKKVFESWSKLYVNSNFTTGDETKLFEKKYALFCGTKYSLGVHSGTDSLIATLKAAGIVTGDEVITTPCTFSATADSIVHVGAKPVFVDIQSKTGNINPNEIVKKITKKTKAILLVHLYGVPCDMKKIMLIAKNNKLVVIEDASHAHGSLYENKKVGSFGLAGCFSLYPSKTLGALGNAGIITSNNRSFITNAAMYANHGIKDLKYKYTHNVSGYNQLIDNLQAAALLQKLPGTNKRIKRKLEIAKKYNNAFKEIGQNGMYWPENTIPSIYVYSFQTKNRNKVANHFKKNHISTGIYYPTPLHLQPSMSFLKHKKGDFPKAELFFNQTLSLPLFPELTDDEVSIVTSAIKLLDK